jgi:homoserine dehydrogenase
VWDEPGVLADITRVLADQKISIDAVIQKEPAEGDDEADLVLLTHRTVEQLINESIELLEILPVVVGKVTRLRMEALGK